jgi:hypothetical protein
MPAIVVGMAPFSTALLRGYGSASYVNRNAAMGRYGCLQLPNLISLLSFLIFSVFAASL